jgi:thioredoxin reductase (NADPH)
LLHNSRRRKFGVLASHHPHGVGVGHVRAGSVKRVAAAVGEGAQVVAALHDYLARTCDHVAPAQVGRP